MVAGEDIKAGQLVLEEKALLKYPQWKTLPTCLGCYKLLYKDKCQPCKLCQWPMCSKECSASPDHKLECKIFAKYGVKLNIKDLKFDQPEPMYDLITPIRMLALKLNDQSGWKALTNLSSHNEIWNEQPAWKKQHQKVIDYILKTMKLNDVTENLILDLYGIAYINDFSALYGDLRLRLVFPRAAMFSHDCTPNIVRHIEGLKDGHTIRCYAARDIRKGEKLNTTYVDLFLPGLIRRAMLKEVRV